MRDAGSYDVVSALIVASNKAKRKLKRQIRIINGTVGVNHRNRLRLMYNKYSKPTFPHRAFGRFQHISQTMGKLIEDGDVEVSPWFKKGIQEANRKFYDGPNRIKGGIGRVELIFTISNIFTQYRANNDIGKFREYIGDDIFFLNFMLNNNKNTLIRIVIFSLLIFGMALTAIPTVMTVIYAVDKFC